MIKILKYFVIIFFILSSNSISDILKPNIKIEPYQVVKIQLKSLMKNDNPTKDRGIEQTWEFAHPNNKKFTGPLDKFQIMLKRKSLFNAFKS